MNAEIRVRINKILKMEVEAVLKPYGMTIQDLIRYFLAEIVSGRITPKDLIAWDEAVTNTTKPTKIPSKVLDETKNK